LEGIPTVTVQLTCRCNKPDYSTSCDMSPTPLQQHILCTIHASMLCCQLRACVPAAHRCKEEEGGRFWAPCFSEDPLSRHTSASKDDQTHTHTQTEIENLRGHVVQGAHCRDTQALAKVSRQTHTHTDRDKVSQGPCSPGSPL